MIGAYLLWGLFPIYWKQLAGVPALQVIGHRIVWSLVFLGVLLLVSRRWKAFRGEALTWRSVKTYLMAGLLVGTNWLVYVWAVGHSFIVETSLGYYINPLFAVLLGVVIIGERWRSAQWIPLGIAAAGVLWLAVAYGGIPWIALSLAFTFGLYGYVKKNAPLRAPDGLTLERGLLLITAIVYLAACDAVGSGAFRHAGSATDLLLVGACVVTTVPLILFAHGAPRIPMSRMGVLQYVNPTMQFLLGVVVFAEHFSGARIAGFALVWIALILLWVEGFHARRAGIPESAPELGD